jgi:hypothetical protein
MRTNSNWAQWEDTEMVLYGTPNNLDVGTWWVNLSAEDEFSNHDFVNFTIEVMNEYPKISFVDELYVTEDIPFEYDLECDDESCGGVIWDISPSNIGWLEIDTQTGILSGTPSNEDVRTYNLNISAEDDHGGIGWLDINLTVLDVNDPPIITTELVTEVLQKHNYYVQFSAVDEDDINIFEWTLVTNAEFLDINNQTGVLSGTPENDDVGSCFVNVTAMDLRGEIDWVNYTLEIIDVNDAPTWASKPPDTQIDQGQEFTFDVDAVDIDIGDNVEYSISSQPDSDISIDESNGEISWIGSLEGLIPNPNYVLNVEVSASDGEETITHGFTITVIPNPSPTSTILGPSEGKRITSEGVLLEWEGVDDGEETLKYDIFLGISHTDVSFLNVNVLWMEDVEETSIHTGELDPGKNYYWTVIPKDLFSSGTCSNGVFSFTINIPPSIQEFSIPEAKIGVEFRLTLRGSDLNGDDLEFDLEEAPSGMDIFNGMITWIPSESQVGKHTINVSLSDGYETVYIEFEATVAEKEIVDEPDDKGSPIVLIIIIVVVILILAGAGYGIFLSLKNKGKEGPTEESTDENHPEHTNPPEEEKKAYNQLHGPP